MGTTAPIVSLSVPLEGVRRIYGAEHRYGGVLVFERISAANRAEILRATSSLELDL
jgi:hypothetical protein